MCYKFNFYGWNFFYICCRPPDPHPPERHTFHVWSGPHLNIGPKSVGLDRPIRKMNLVSLSSPKESTVRIFSPTIDGHDLSYFFLNLSALVVFSSSWTSCNALPISLSLWGSARQNRNPSAGEEERKTPQSEISVCNRTLVFIVDYEEKDCRFL